MNLTAPLTDLTNKLFLSFSHKHMIELSLTTFNVQQNDHKFNPSLIMFYLFLIII